LGRDSLNSHQNHLAVKSSSINQMLRNAIVLNGRFLAQTQTGVQRYAVETIRAMDKHITSHASQLNLPELVLAIPSDAKMLELDWIKQHRVPGKSGHLWEQYHLRRFADRKYLVNFNYSGPLFKRSQLVTFHDTAIRAMPECYKWKYRYMSNTLMYLLGRTADSVMTVSEFSKKEIIRFYGLSSDKIIVGREGGEHLTTRNDDLSILNKYGLNAGCYVLGVGSVKPSKNYGLIGKAMQHLPNFPLPIAIAGAKDIGIFRSASKIEGDFNFLGFVPDKDLPSLYRHAKCFLFPSLYEGFGLPAIEAMANDCPVVAANAASIPEVCGDAALYFDPTCPRSCAAALQTAVSDNELLARLVKAGRERLKVYNWNANAQILLSYLSSLK
jgi:glycosyltransferase involved in cell wall biosynthesis